MRWRRTEGPQTVRAATAKPGQEGLGGIIKKKRKTGFWVPKRIQTLAKPVSPRGREEKMQG